MFLRRPERKLGKKFWIALYASMVINLLIAAAVIALIIWIVLRLTS